MSTPTIDLINPLPLSLAHFEAELAHQLGVVEHSLRVLTVPSTSIEMSPEQSGRTGTLWRLVRERWILGKRARDRSILILWPALGYLDILTWVRAARRNRVFLIIHDPVPLRRQIGYSRISRWTFRIIARISSVRIVSLTETARRDILDATGTESLVVPHPVLVDFDGHTPSDDVVIRVLGQYKSARNLRALEQIARSFAGSGIRLEIAGRGWPELEGWHVEDRFIDEAEFDSLIQTAQCVVIPYRYFYQSGIAVRCLEKGVPIVGPNHEQLAELYGQDWPGLVDDDECWSAGVRDVLALETNPLEARLGSYSNDSRIKWLSLLSDNS